jgi:hypothetical protein
MIEYRANVYSGEDGSFLFRKRFDTLTGSADFILEHLERGFAVEMIKMESCQFNALKTSGGNIIQSDVDGFCYKTH